MDKKIEHQANDPQHAINNFWYATYLNTLKPMCEGWDSLFDIGQDDQDGGNSLDNKNPPSVRVQGPEP